MKALLQSPGLNRTGNELSPDGAMAMADYAEQHSPAPETGPDSMAIAAVRCDYVAEAEAIGSIPPTLHASGQGKMARGATAVLLDKLGERLAFERSGVRLYQALIDKATTLESDGPLPFTQAELEHIRDEELQHMLWVDGAIKALGGDATAQTPCADVIGVASSGIMQVLSDPRTDIAQCLNALLTAELADLAGWELLIRLAGEVGADASLLNFRAAERHEHEHLEKVRAWLTDGVLRQLH